MPDIPEVPSESMAFTIAKTGERIAIPADAKFKVTGTATTVMLLDGVEYEGQFTTNLGIPLFDDNPLT